MPKILVVCCGGNERYEGQCLKCRCPHYNKAEKQVRARWSYEGSISFKNPRGIPRHADFLDRVRSNN